MVKCSTFVIGLLLCETLPASAFQRIKLSYFVPGRRRSCTSVPGNKRNSFDRYASCNENDCRNNEKPKRGKDSWWNHGFDNFDFKRRLTTAVGSMVLCGSIVATPWTFQYLDDSRVSPTPFFNVVERMTAQAVDPLTKNQRFVSDVWFAVTAQFFDPTFGGLGEDGWRTQRDQAIAAVEGLEDRSRVDKVIDTMLASLGDPYTRYLPPDQYQAITAYTRGSDDTNSASASIGVQLLSDGKSSSSGGGVTVMNTVKDGPAALAGVSVGDVVLEVDGWSMEDATPEFVAAKCRGAPGTRVALTVQRRGDGVKQFSVTRDNLKVRSVDSSTFLSDYSGVTLGLLRVSSFTQNTAAEIANGMQELLTKNKADGKSDTSPLAAIVIDLRGNVGGYMPAGIDAARKFLPARAAVVAEIDRAGSGTYYFGDGKVGSDTSTPLYVLVDERTASAAEIFTAALKDNRRATVVGPTKTFGKGRIQNIQSLEDGSGIAVTRARYITPAGRDIHGIGIKPNKLSETCGPEASAAACIYGFI